MSQCVLRVYSPGSVVDIQSSKTAYKAAFPDIATSEVQEKASAREVDAFNSALSIVGVLSLDLTHRVLIRTSGEL